MIQVRHQPVDRVVVGAVCAVLGNGFGHLRLARGDECMLRRRRRARLCIRLLLLFVCSHVGLEVRNLPTVGALGEVLEIWVRQTTYRSRPCRAYVPCLRASPPMPRSPQSYSASHGAARRPCPPRASRARRGCVRPWRACAPVQPSVSAHARAVMPALRQLPAGLPTQTRSS